MTATLVKGLARRHGDRILAALGEAPAGLTDFELAERLGIYLSSVNAARNSLVRQGKVASTGRSKPSGRGGFATIWRAA